MESTTLGLSYPSQNSLYNFPSVIAEDALRVGALLLQHDYSANSRIAIVADLKAFFGWLSEKTQEEFDFERITERDIGDFRDDCRRKGLAVKTINRRLVSIRLFLNVAVEEELLKKNPAKNVKQLSVQPLAPKSLSQQETRKFLREVEIRGNLRDRLLVELMLGAGLRVSEAVNLNVEDVQLSERKGLVTVRNGKGGKERSIPLHPNIRRLLSEYLDSEKSTGKLFKGQRGVLTTMGVHMLVKKYGKKAGIDIHSHLLRHTFAMNYLKANPASIQTLSQLMGHSSLEITSCYLQHTVEQLEEGIERMSY
jgi:site-specific recombinase XerD